MDCTCDTWKNNIDLINAPWVVETGRNPTLARGYRGVRFRFCPWCARPLADVELMRFRAEPKTFKGLVVFWWTNVLKRPLVHIICVVLGLGFGALCAYWWLRLRGP